MSIIHGYIASSGEDDRRLEELNENVLKLLPYKGEYVCRDMFAMLPYNNKSTSKYQHLIHFAAEYDETYAMPSEWIQRFEDLLSKLCWNQACAIETYSGTRFQWTKHLDKLQQNAIEPTTTWERKIYSSYHNLGETTAEESIF